LTEDAKTTLQEYYVSTRTQNNDSDTIPITVQKLESLVRLAEASARMRLSDDITETDAERVIEFVDSTFYAQQESTDDTDTDTSDETEYPESFYKLKKPVKNIISNINENQRGGASIDQILEKASDEGHSAGEVEAVIEKLRVKGEVYEPKQGHLRTT
jgi:replicative DNA helicase Mcm